MPQSLPFYLIACVAISLLFVGCGSEKKSLIVKRASAIETQPISATTAGTAMPQATTPQATTPTPSPTPVLAASPIVTVAPTPLAAPIYEGRYTEVAQRSLTTVIPACGASFGGRRAVEYSNGDATSSMATIAFPLACSNPLVFTSSEVRALPCGNEDAPRTCVNRPGFSNTPVRAYFDALSNTGLKAYLSADDGLWVESEAEYPVDFAVTCNPSGAPLCAKAVGPLSYTVAGKAHTGFYNGQMKSTSFRVNYPAACPRPTIRVQSYADSIKCGDGMGPKVCANAPGTTSRDLVAEVENVGPLGFDIVLRSGSPVWVGAASPAFPVAWELRCDI